MAWTEAECNLLRESLKQNEISFANAEKMPNSPTKADLLRLFAAAVKRLSEEVDRSCAPRPPE